MIENRTEATEGAFVRHVGLLIAFLVFAVISGMCATGDHPFMAICPAGLSCVCYFYFFKNLGW